MDQKLRHIQRPYGLKLLVFIFASLFLNVFFFCFVFLSSRVQQPGWTRIAASEAEIVAAIDCSGHGRAFLDGIIVDGLPTCECNTCYGGSDCSRPPMPDCPADVDSGNPLFLEPYWQRRAADSAVVLSGWHRMSYGTTGPDYISVELEKHVRLLHAAVGNAVAENKFIEFGAGSTQLLNALVSALSPDPNTSSSPASVVAAIPYYPMYERQTKVFDGREYIWRGMDSIWANTSFPSTSGFIEFVTSPNNPDGFLKRAVLNASSVINDHAYYWPYYTAIPAPADEDVMIFTISKITGHAGSRFGWALIKDEKTAQKVKTYLGVNTMGVSRDTQLRALKLIKVVLQQRGGSGDIFAHGYRTLKERWNKLHTLVSSSQGRFSLQDLSPQYCTYFKTIREPSPAYAWLKCEFEEDGDCYGVLEDAGIVTRSGTLFGADARYTRLSLIKSDDDFDLLMQRMKALVVVSLKLKEAATPRYDNRLAQR